AEGRPADRAAVRDHRHARVVYARAGAGGARRARREGLRQRLEEDDRTDHRRGSRCVEAEEGAGGRGAAAQRERAESAPRRLSFANASTKRSCSLCAASQLTGWPFCTSTNAYRLPTYPESAEAIAVVP